MKNFVQPGHTITVTSPSGGVSSGNPVLIGSFFGVAAFDAAQALPLELAIEGVFILPKATGATWTLGDPLYWDASGKQLTKVVGDNLRVATAAADAASGDVLGTAKLAPSGATLVGLTAPQAAIPDLSGTLTGTVNGSLVDIAAAAGACAGGSTPTATQVDTAIATAVATIVTGVNEQNKELQAKLNAALAALRGANLITD